MDIGTVMYWLENARNHELFVISKVAGFLQVIRRQPCYFDP
jgi:hypothetical protein